MLISATYFGRTRRGTVEQTSIQADHVELILDKLNAATVFVVNVNDPATRSLISRAAEQGSFIYIGRGGRGRRGTSYRKSTWHNPYRIGRDGDRDTVLDLYKQQYLPACPDLTARLCAGELAGMVLGCHCVPEACHGHILATLTLAPREQETV